MTYCVGLLLNEGVVMLSDTRTNAGLDNIATFKKTFVFEEPGERVIVILTAGSLSVTQTTIGWLQEAIDDGEDGKSIMEADTMLDVASIIGNTLSEVATDIQEKMDRMKQTATASFIVAGQRKGGEMRLFMIYPEGNFIEATDDTPYLQIGEHKYGKPILDRVITKETSMKDAAKAALLSMDSTMRSNLSVGMPLDLTFVANDACKVTETQRIEAGDAHFAAMSHEWSEALRKAFVEIN